MNKEDVILEKLDGISGYLSDIREDIGYLRATSEAHAKQIDALEARTLKNATAIQSVEKNLHGLKAKLAVVSGVAAFIITFVIDSIRSAMR